MGPPQGGMGAMPQASTEKPWEQPMPGNQMPRFQAPPPASTAAPGNYRIMPGQGTLEGIVGERQRMNEAFAPLGTEAGPIGSQSPGVSSQDATAIETLLQKLRSVFGGQ